MYMNRQSTKNSSIRCNTRLFFIVVLIVSVSIFHFSAQGAVQSDTLAIADRPDVNKDSIAKVYEEEDAIIMLDMDDDIEFDTSGEYQEALTDSISEEEELTVVKMPEITRFVKAAYPDDLCRAGVEGAVLLELLVTETGVVESVTVNKSLNSVLDSCAVLAARQFHFTPAFLSDSTPAAVLLLYEYQFSLEEAARKIEPVVNFKGQIIERGTRAPIADAMVVVSFAENVVDSGLPVPLEVYLETIGGFPGQYIEEKCLVALTDSTGNFTFYSLPACSITISSPQAGYETLSEREYVKSGELIVAKYYMERISYSDYEIVVYGKQEKKEVSRHHIEMGEMKKVAGVSGDAIKVIQTMPGVARPTFASGEIVVRGAESWDSRYYLNGCPHYMLFHMGALKASYNSEAVQSTEFYPGGYGVKYGNVMGGVIEVEGRSARTDRVHGYVDASLLDASFLVEGPVVKDKLSAMGSMRYSLIGQELKWAQNNFDLQIPYYLAPFYRDYLFRMDFTPNKSHDLFMTFFGFKNGIELIYPKMRGGGNVVEGAADRMYADWVWHTMLTGWDWHINDRVKNEFRASLMYESDSMSLFGTAKYIDTEKAMFCKDEITWIPREKLNFNLGISYESDTWNAIMDRIGTDNEFVSDTVKGKFYLNAAMYGYLEWKPVKNLLIVPGLRYDYYGDLIHNGSIVPEFANYESFDNERGISGDPSFRMFSRYAVNEKHLIKAAIGNYNQRPQPYYVRSEPWGGNPEIPTSKAAHYVIGHEWKITDLIHSDVQMFLNRQWDLPRENIVDSAGTNFGQAHFLGNGKGRMRGIEMILRHDQGKRFFGWLSYTLMKSERYSYKEDEYINFSIDQTHNIVLVASWLFNRNWNLGFRMQYTTGNPETPVVGSKYHEHMHVYTPVYGKENSGRVPPHFQIDLRIDKVFVYKNWMLSTYIDVVNASYPLYKSPQDYIYNYDPYLYPEQKQDRMAVNQIIIPSIGIKADF